MEHLLIPPLKYQIGLERLVRSKHSKLFLRYRKKFYNVDTRHDLKTPRLGPWVAVLVVNQPNESLKVRIYSQATNQVTVGIQDQV